MKRKQIYLTEQIDGERKRLAQARGRSESDLIREALQRYLSQETAEADPWRSLVGLARGGGPDESTRVDEVAYGKHPDDRP